MKMALTLHSIVMSSFNSEAASFLGVGHCFVDENVLICFLSAKACARVTPTNHIDRRQNDRCLDVMAIDNTHTNTACVLYILKLRFLPNFGNTIGPDHRSDVDDAFAAQQAATIDAQPLCRPNIYIYIYFMHADDGHGQQSVFKSSFRVCHTAAGVPPLFTHTRASARLLGKGVCLCLCFHQKRTIRAFTKNSNDTFLNAR